MTTISPLPAALRTRAADVGRRFPTDFVWGAATAAPQIEGSVDADGRTPSIWDVFARVPGTVADGDTLDRADEHYLRWRDDVALMSDLGVDAYRFSIAWPRIVPVGDGVVNRRGLDFYDALVDELLGKGIEPFATLYHWDLPQWQQERGGWADRSVAHRFAEYASLVADRLGDRVRNWMTLNEPWVYVFLGHLDGVHAPGIRSEEQAVRAMHHSLLAHGLGTQALRAALPADRNVGIALSMSPAEPATRSPEDAAAAERFDLYRNWLFLHPITHGEYHPGTEALFDEEIPIEAGDLEVIASPIDFVGINYYARGVVQADDSVPVIRAKETPPAGVFTAMGWEVHAQGIADIVVQTHEKYAPGAIYITENGSAWDDEEASDGSIVDTPRVDYLLDHLTAAAGCLDTGAPLRGYFAWSLLDNFEWAEGYRKRFGIVHVDYPTQRRTVKQSGAVYRAVALVNVEDEHGDGDGVIDRIDMVP
ncbi:GH1 family beta-glucosidase [Microbacterium azadirachtae]|uniref:Beta-glucosidase n=1 Tax=Microbacterium azadirachtae TaxID=582680 RepID=A0A1I6G9J9_9MICO|nr:GH1 family beta-glucosidase [Microbacterium azadirachtae]SDL38188.1 beta-glucosidase [Microbacterium azadirachtae]SEF69179.1 beta-glucosidase [Microbacterium azadirachtae]SEF69883.1 beta-glucosidase [Microbacterium azadirachtae]SFR38811.1 beta-glucosidase [Microbacterium azadirachtae]